MIDACDRRSETASYRTADWWSLGGGLLKFPGYVPLFDSWSQGMKSTYQHE